MMQLNYVVQCQCFDDIYWEGVSAVSAQAAADTIRRETEYVRVLCVCLVVTDWE